MGETLPDGFREIALPWARAVVHDSLREDVAAALQHGAVYDYARTRPDARAFTGRGQAYAFSAPASGQPVLVRRSRHGGLLAPLTGELFVGAGRAPAELRISLQLKQRGVPTPDVLGYVVYPVPPFFCRVDVLLRFVPDSRDLVSVLIAEDDASVRARSGGAALKLMQVMADAGVRHPDLNLRNVLITNGEQGPTAWLLDVDRVTFDSAPAAEIADANMSRFVRSILKLQKKGVLRIDAGELRAIYAARATRL